MIFSIGALLMLIALTDAAVGPGDRVRVADVAGAAAGPVGTESLRRAILLGVVTAQDEHLLRTRGEHVCHRRAADEPVPPVIRKRWSFGEGNT